MSRLLAYMSNDPQRIRCALHPGRAALAPEPAADAPSTHASAIPSPTDAWGLGFYQGGEVLLQRRPKPPTEPLDLYETVRDLKTDCLIAHERCATVGLSKTENTHPFRFRSWLFAHQGTVADFGERAEAMRQEIPDFLRRNLRGQTDSEHLFHLFLAELQKGHRLDDIDLPVRAAAQALDATLKLAERIGHTGGAGSPSTLNLAVTNGRILLCTRRGRPLHLYRLSGVRDCPACRESPGDPARMGRPVDHEHLRAVVLVSGASAQAARGGPWEEVAEGTLVGVSHDLTIERRPLTA